ncbi:IS3 family transposase, partial [Ruminococcus bicirculans (ex Wegman et al. 2014)]
MYREFFAGPPVAENFFGLLKTELLYLQEFHSVEH